MISSANAASPTRMLFMRSPRQPTCRTRSLGSAIDGRMQSGIPNGLTQIAYLNKLSAATFVFTRQDHVLPFHPKLLDQIGKPIDIAPRSHDGAPQQARFDRFAAL